MWFFAGGAIALGVAGGVVLAVILGGVINWFREKRYVAVHAPLIVMGVGGTDALKATLIRKPPFSGSAGFVTVPGTITVSTNGNTYFALPGGGATTTFAAGGSAALNGVMIGSGKATASGVDATGRTYRSTDVQVDVIAVPPGGVLAFYRAAVARGQAYWANSAFGNILINWLGLGRGGLCDEWAEWTSDWIRRNNDGTICLCELVYWPGPFGGGPGQHVCIRVTTCAGATCTGPIYYLDPHRETNAPAMLSGPYVAKYGLPPGPNFVLWGAPCAATGAGGGGGSGGTSGGSTQPDGH